MKPRMGVGSLVAVNFIKAIGWLIINRLKSSEKGKNM
jgi:hypothetical protein